MIMTILYLLFVALAVTCTPLRHASAQSGDSDASSEIEIQSGDGVTPDPPRNSGTGAGSHSSRCIPTPTIVTVEVHGCNGTYPSFSCTGYCYSASKPNTFMSREQTRQVGVEVFRSRCTCCSSIGALIWTRRITLTCPNSTSVTVPHLHVMATECKCILCSS